MNYKKLKEILVSKLEIHATDLTTDEELATTIIDLVQSTDTVTPWVGSEIIGNCSKGNIYTCKHWKDQESGCYKCELSHQPK